MLKKWQTFEDPEGTLVPIGFDSLPFKPKRIFYVCNVPIGDKMVWDSQVFTTGNDILLSICSTAYDREDYIEDFDEFLRIVNLDLCLINWEKDGGYV